MKKRNYQRPVAEIIATKDFVPLMAGSVKTSGIYDETQGKNIDGSPTIGTGSGSDDPDAKANTIWGGDDEE